MKERNYRDKIRGLSSLLGMEFFSEWRVKTFHNFMVKVGIYSETLRASNRLLDKSLDMIPPCIKGMLRDIYKVEKKPKSANTVVSVETDKPIRQRSNKNIKLLMSVGLLQLELLINLSTVCCKE